MSNSLRPELSPIGYSWLARHFAVDPIPHFVESFVVERGIRRTETQGNRLREFYPRGSTQITTLFDHLHFAMKREGLHLELLRLVLPQLKPAELTAHILSTPTGANARRLWCLYESFSGKSLPIGNLQMGNYIDLADSKLYYCRPLASAARKLSRWRINLNLLGNLRFSPMIRRTETLRDWDAANLRQRCVTLIGKVSADIFERALRFLYAKETKTSYAIERETPSQQRAERFMALLARAGDEDFLNEPGLVELQNAIVDSRFVAEGWRTWQNYVGQSLAPGVEDIHLVPPRPDDLPELMQAWLEVSQDLILETDLPAIPAAAAVAWIFVYLHPFEDGNGRIHRFLIHHVLARRRFGPPGVLLPVSAVMLARPADYDASLESFSRPLKERSDYDLDEMGAMTVTNATDGHFRYIDCTAAAEALYSFLAETIDKEVPAELAFLRAHDRARAAMREVVDLPEISANLFLRLCHQHGGHLSKTKRAHPAFARLSDTEIHLLEKAISEAWAEDSDEQT